MACVERVAELGQRGLGDGLAAEHGPAHELLDRHAQPAPAPAPRLRPVGGEVLADAVGVGRDLPRGEREHRAVQPAVTHPLVAERRPHLPQLRVDGAVAAEEDGQAVVALRHVLEQGDRRLGRARRVGRHPVGEPRQHGADVGLREARGKARHRGVVRVHEARLRQRQPPRDRGADRLDVGGQLAREVLDQGVDTRALRLGVEVERGDPAARRGCDPGRAPLLEVDDGRHALPRLAGAEAPEKAPAAVPQPRPHGDAHPHRRDAREALGGEPALRGDHAGEPLAVGHRLTPAARAGAPAAR